MEIVHRIREKMKEKGLKQKDLVSYLKESQSAVSKWLSTNEKVNNNIPVEILSKIATFLDIDIGVLLSGEKKESQDGGNVDILYYENSYGCLGDGVTNDNESASPITFKRNFLEKKIGKYKFEKMHIINSSGDSMSPLIKSGELLFINPFENEGNLIKNGDIYSILLKDTIVVKRIEHNPLDGLYTLHSENSDYPTININEENMKHFKVIGRVIAHFNFL